MGEPTDQPVLIVDDDDELREVLRDVLQEAGYRVEDAASGRSALERLRTMAVLPSMILLDHAMPDMDGVGLLAALEADPKLGEVPVLMMSGLGRGSNTEAKRNVRAFLQKPLRLSDVLRAVGNR